MAKIDERTVERFEVNVYRFGDGNYLVCGRGLHAEMRFGPSTFHRYFPHMKLGRGEMISAHMMLRKADESAKPERW